MKRALCIAVSIAVMVVFSFADVMAITETPGGEPDESVIPEEEIVEEPAVEEPAAEVPDETDVDATAEEETDADVEEPAEAEEPAAEPAAEPEVTTKALEGVSLTAAAGDGKVDLEWAYTGTVADQSKVTFAVYKNKETTPIKGAEALPITTTTYSVAGLDNGTTYTFQVVATDSSTEPATVVESNEVSAKTVATRPGKVTGLKWTHDYASVNLTWNKVEGADGYIVYRNGTEICKEKNLNWNQVKEQKETKKTVTWRVRAMERKGTSLANYTFEVVAFKYKDATKNIDTALKSKKKAKVEKCSPCRALYATFTPKRSGYAYKSARGKKKGMKLKKGKKYIAKGFVCSRFRVCKSDNSGKVYFYPRVMGNNKKLIYSTKISYTHKEAADFVNHMGLKSGSKYLVWVSLYTQHIYFFKGSKGKWKPIKGKNWEISSGKLMSCTATGNWKVFRKWRKRRGLSYWTNFYSQVAMHSWGNPSCFGVPHSGGCVRNTYNQAKWIYNTIPMKTTVCVY